MISLARPIRPAGRGPARSFVIGLMLLLTCLLAGSAGFAGEPEEDRPSRRERRRKALLEGTHVLRRILFDGGLRPLEEFEALGEDPARTLLIVLGDLNALRDVPGGLDKFVRGGGAVLAASDRPVTDDDARRGLLAVAGVSINHESLVCTTSFLCYRGVTYCPFIRPVPGAFPPIFRDAAGGFQTQLGVASNIPSHLRVRREFPGTVRPLATLPPGCVLDTPHGLMPAEQEMPLFAVGGELGDGQVLVLADHSLFINEMMLPGDTNNVEFAYNVLRWLRGRGGVRDRVLFVEEGRIETRLQIPLRSVAIPPEEALRMLFARRNDLLVQGERALGRLEREGGHDRAVFAVLDRLGLPPERLLRGLLALTTLAVLAVLFYRLGIRARFRHDSTVPVLAEGLARNLPPGPLVEQRQQALVRLGNLREPAALLVRRWFARLGLDPRLTTPPTFEVRGGWLRRWRLRVRLWQLWRLATGQSMPRIHAPGLWRLQRELEQLQAGWQRGDWHVAAG